jgi:uncharacterized membrane protein
MRAGRGRRGDSDEGMVTAFVIVFAAALIFICGLVLDGGRILATKREAGNVAESAARAGAQAISEDAVRSGADVVLDPGGVRTAACAFLGRAGYACGEAATVGSDGNRVTVTLHESVDLVLLPVGSQSFTVSGTACVARGITGVEPTAGC